MIDELLRSSWWLLIAALGLPSVLIRRVERKLDQREAQREAMEERRQKLLCNLSKSTMAAIALGEATARAVQRIPDAHCNGDMKAALRYADRVRQEQKDFLTAIGVGALYEETGGM